MNIRTFTATRMPDALALVRKSIGPNAVILHTRSYKQGGVFGIGARTVVEVTAADGREVGKARRQSGGDAPKAKSVRTNAAGEARARSARVNSSRARSADEGAMGESAGDLIRRTYQVAQAEAAAGGRPPGGDAGVDVNQLAAEMQAVKGLVQQVAQQQKQVLTLGGRADVPEALFDQYLELLQNEVADELAHEVIEEVSQRMKTDESADAGAVRTSIHQALAKLVPADEQADALAPTTDGRPRTIALIGPTGVGKTTTVAKLAANFKLRHKRRVSLITMDTYRIAAVDQLRTYANIIDVPLHVVSQPDEMIAAMQQCAGSQVVLIDTAGRSQRDDPKLDQLHSLIQAARPHQVHLVLASTCTQKVLLDAIERFSRIQTDRIIFTKLDEAVTYGVLLNVARQVNKQLSFLTTGQEVPHHIEATRGERLASLVLGEGLNDQPQDTADGAPNIATAGAAKGAGDTVWA